MKRIAKVCFYTFIITLLLGTTFLPAQSDFIPNTPELYACWFQKAHSRDFKNENTSKKPGKTLKIIGKSFGMYTGGTSGLLNPFTNCAKERLHLGKKHYHQEKIIAKFAGLPVLKRVKENKFFNYYNPQIIYWGSRYLIPDPRNQIDGITYQEVYRVIFQRFARLNTESYLYLTKRKNFQEIQLKQLKALLNPDSDKHDFSWMDVLKEYEIKDTIGYYHPAQPYSVLSFWVRRGLDGTHEAVWHGLSKAMKLYDGRWFAKTLRKYGN